MPVMRALLGSRPRARGARAAAALAAVALVWTPAAAAYDWPLKPFDKPHALRGTFADPRYHLDAEGSLSSFHFGIDIAARDGTPVYAVEPGRAVDVRATSVAVHRPNGRTFGYWHIKPVVKAGRHIRLHQLLGRVLPGWGHVHFAEAFDGEYRNPLRKGALSPFYDHTVPTVAWIKVFAPDGSPVLGEHVAGSIDIEASVYDTPPILPPPPWQFARLAPASVWWQLERDGVVVQTDLAAYFGFALPPDDLYNWTYAPGTYQNKPFRPGNYIFWLAHDFDTTGLPDGSYQLDVLADDTRGNIGSATVDLTISN
jgi:murein DD-endopeptidase MepM/ murein hydrolase activator NlpD